MGEQMEFPETFEAFVKEYGFKDDKEVYTNGSDLIPIFRVKQWLEHDNKLRAIETDTAYECGKHANKWIPCKVRLPEENGVYIVSYEDSVRLLAWFNGKWFFHPSNPARKETGTVIAWQPLPEPYEDNAKTYNDIYNEFC
jgi:hypothetical protein